MVFIVPKKPLVESFKFNEASNWCDPYFASFKRMKFNLKIAESTPAMWKKMKTAEDLVDLLDMHPHFSLLVLDQQDQPTFLHTLSYDPVSKVFAGINGSSYTEKPIMFKLPDVFFDTAGESLKAVSKSLLGNYRFMRDFYHLKQRSSSTEVTDDDNPDSDSDGDILHDFTQLDRFRRHDLQGTIFPPYLDFLSSRFPFRALELGLEHAGINVFHHSVLLEPPEVELDEDDVMVYMPGLCLVPPLLIADFIKMSNMHGDSILSGISDRLSGIDPVQIIPWLLAHCDDVAELSGASDPKSLQNFRILIHWLMVWLDFALGFNFPKVEVTEFDHDEASAYILSRVPATVQDSVAALL